MSLSAARATHIQQIILSATIEGRTLRIGVSGKKVVWAHHEGAEGQHEMAILQRVCDEMIGRSPREASEHSAVYAADALARSGLLKRPAGISLPHAMGPALDRAEKLSHKIYRNSTFWEENLGEWNFEDRGLSAQWVSKDKSEKLAKIGELLTRFFKDQNISDSAFSIAQIDKNERIDISFGDAVVIFDKPTMLMGFEKFLHDHTGERLEVFVAEMKDLNRIRRL